MNNRNLTDDLRKLAAAATPGPWYIGAQNDATFIIAGRAPAPDNDSPWHDAPRTVIARVYEKHNEAFTKAANPAAIIALLDSHEAEVKALTDRVAELEQAIKNAHAVAFTAAENWHTTSANEQEGYGNHEKAQFHRACADVMVILRKGAKYRRAAAMEGK